MSDAISIGTVPTGSTVIRKANMDDLRIDPSRVVLIETPDGQRRWLPERKDKQGVLSGSPAQAIIDDIERVRRSLPASKQDDLDALVQAIEDEPQDD
jgi:hypothetical protein